MHPFDIIVFIVLLIFIFIGMKDGLIEGVFQLAAVAGGFAGAFAFYRIVYDKIGFIKLSAHNLTVVSFIITFIIFLCAILLIGWFIKKVIHLTPIGWIDRLLGGIFGLLKASVLIWVFMLTVFLLPVSHLKSNFTKSITYEIFKALPFRLAIPKIADIKKLESSITNGLKEKKEKLDGLKGKIRETHSKRNSDSI
jgi:membrane protein required for colicin V production